MHVSQLSRDSDRTSKSVRVRVLYTCVLRCSLLAFLPAEARRRAPRVLPASPQSGATDVRVAGACRRLLLVSPLHAGFWSSISWLCNLFLAGQGGGRMCVLLCAFRRRGGVRGSGANVWLRAEQCERCERTLNPD